MKTFNLNELHQNTEKLQQETEQGHLSLITQKNRPLFVSVPFDEKMMQYGVHTALARNLFKSGDLNLGKAAKLANMSIAEFIKHVSLLGIPVVDMTEEEFEREMKYLDL